MNASECSKRAEECLAAAQYASDRDAQRNWRQIADVWLLWSEQLGKLRVDNEKSETAELTTGGIVPMKGEAADAADQLRSWLALIVTHEIG